MKLVQCNKCKKQKPKEEWYDDKSPWVEGHISGQHINVSFDLCGDCGTKLAQYVKKYFGIKEEKLK
ncbi:MAG: hypothetical protein Q7S48_04270 [bacterium]|nr:hypothetical protein [bacterium]